jgi:methylated-DNA-[protein]-cysteine S-methyltransferase
VGVVHADNDEYLHPRTALSYLLEKTHTLIVQSPVGQILLRASDDQLLYLRIGGSFVSSDSPIPLLLRAQQQLEEYFAGRRQTFDLPLSPHGTMFQRRVWAALRNVPYGTTLSYAALAEVAGCAGAQRAVGSANAHNPLPILIPCHRIIRSDGSLGGYAYGVETKRFLLNLEGYDT